MSNILSERSSNILVSPEKKDNKDSKETPKSLEYHRQILESRLKEGKSVVISLQSSTASPAKALVGIAHAHHLVTLSSASQTYVSPSDTIQSPATQKLAAFRTKHLKAWVWIVPQSFVNNTDTRFKHSAKPRSLFAKTTAKNAQSDLASTSTSTDSSQESEKSLWWNLVPHWFGWSCRGMMILVVRINVLLCWIAWTLSDDGICTVWLEFWDMDTCMNCLSAC